MSSASNSSPGSAGCEPSTLLSVPSAASLANALGYNDIWAIALGADGAACTPLESSTTAVPAPRLTALASPNISASAHRDDGVGGGDNISSSIGTGTRVATKPKRASSTPSKKGNAVLEWSDVMVRDLMTLRYETHTERFMKAKNNAALKAAWLLLATEISGNQKTPISSEQCKNKLKWLKRKWAEYNAEARATGNSEVEVLEPPGLDLMQEFWSGSSGMNAQTLADSEMDGAALLSDGDTCSEADTSEQSHVKQGGNGKKRKTMGDSCEIGMQSIAEGFQAMAAAMVPAPAETNVSSDRGLADMIDARFEAMMQRQDAQLAQRQLQNQQLTALVTALQRGSGN